MNSFLNPIIYAKYNRDFRTPFKEILICRCRKINARLRTESYAEQYGLPLRTVKRRGGARNPARRKSSELVVSVNRSGKVCSYLSNGTQGTDAWLPPPPPPRLVSCFRICLVWKALIFQLCIMLPSWTGVEPMEVDFAICWKDSQFFYELFIESDHKANCSCVWMRDGMKKSICRTFSKKMSPVCLCCPVSPWLLENF